MKSAKMAMVAGCLLAVAGCSQPYRTGMGMGSQGVGGQGMGMMDGDGWDHGCRDSRDGMGPQMMGGLGMARLDLTYEQRATIAEIRMTLSRKQGALMAQMHASGSHPRGGYRDGPFDEQAARKWHEAMAGVRQQMFENRLEARKRIDSVLTPQQREQLGRPAAGQ
ncbi:MAG: Spy/CpxP family protein refolding chaperone [Polaromonas sp.]|nr:Spy/CpxP family protein refolding chaperone [Polaromonas sp.]